MLRITSLLFALLVSWSACAQVPLTGAGKGAPGGGVTYQGLGDVVALSKYWGCPRAVTAAYAAGGGALCDVVDSATGLVTCTLHALPTGFVNTTECNATACAIACKVTKEYNQIANGTADKVNVTLANMPVLTFSAINGLPAPQYTAANSQVLATSSTITQTAPVTMGAVFKRTAVVGAGYLSPAAAAVEIRGSSSASTAVVACGTNVNVTASDNAWHGINMLCSGVANTSAYNIDGVYNSAQNMGTTALSAQTLQSGKSSGSVFLTGLVAETFEAVGLSPTDSAVVYTNQHGVNGYNGAF